MVFSIAFVLALATPSLTDAAHVGVLFSSFGDVESCDCIDSYWPNALAQLVNYEIPVPSFSRGFFGKLVWKFSRKETFAQYKAIAEDCNTHYQEHAPAQAERVVGVLRTLMPKEKFTAYTGYNFVSGKGCPSGVTVIDQARKALSEGVDKLVLVNQNGAQQSNTSIGVAYEQIAPILKGPEWNNVEVLGLDDYSQKTGFEELVVDFLTSQFHSLLGSKGVAPRDTCMMLAAHGNPSRIETGGDPYEMFIRKNYAAVEHHFSEQGFRVFLAFQNHGGKGQTFPQSLFPWSGPPDTDVAPEIAKMNCTHVFVSGILSFVIDNSETLFDENIDDRRMMHGKSVVVTPMFNDDGGFATFLAKAISEALEKSAFRNLKEHFQLQSQQVVI